MEFYLEWYVDRKNLHEVWKRTRCNNWSKKSTSYFKGMEKELANRKYPIMQC